MKFLHTGFAVHDIERSVALYRKLFGFRFEPIREYALTSELHGRPNPIRTLVTHGFTDDDTEFEMVQNLSGTSSDSLVLGDREGLSHIAFTVEDLASARLDMEREGLEMVYCFESPKVDFQFFRGPGLAGILIQLVRFHGERDGHLSD